MIGAGFFRVTSNDTLLSFVSLLVVNDGHVADFGPTLTGKLFVVG